MGHLVCILGILATATSLVYGGHLIIAPPDMPGLGTAEAVMVIVPEFGVKATDYEILGVMLQSACEFRLWIAVLDLKSEEYLTIEDTIPFLLLDAKRELERSGLSSKAARFLAAHGRVGQVITAYAQAVPDETSGIILLGACPDNHVITASYPVQVLTILGDLDGVARITRLGSIVQLVEERANSPTESEYHIRNPLVVVEGSNHAVFTVGTLPESLLQLDIPEEVEHLEALHSITELIGDFLSSTMNYSQNSVERARNLFQSSFKRAQEITLPIRTLMNMTQVNMKSYWVKAVQKWLSGLEGPESTLIEVDSFVTDNTILPLPPIIGPEGGINLVVTFSDVLTPDNNDGDLMRSSKEGAASIAPLEIAARMIGPERIQSYVGSASPGPNYTCSDLNYAAYQTAYHTASPTARERYDKVHPGVHFMPDINLPSEVEWKSKLLSVDWRGRSVYVTSAAYRTRNDAMLSQYAGLYFCKLLPPDRALEWIYVDSLRRGANLTGAGLPLPSHAFPSTDSVWGSAPVSPRSRRHLPWEGLWEFPNGVESDTYF